MTTATEDLIGPEHPHPKSYRELRRTSPPRPITKRLRDEFAMAAVTGLMASGNATPDDIAKSAYKVADAMMKARSE